MGKKLPSHLTELRKHLTAAAGQRKLVHYKEVAQILGIASNRLDHSKEMALALDEILLYSSNDVPV